MSLKVFHIFFVSVCILFAVGFGGWEIAAYARTRGPADLLLGVGSLVLAGALVVYFRWFLQKLKGVG